LDTDLIGGNSEAAAHFLLTDAEGLVPGDAAGVTGAGDLELDDLAGGGDVAEAGLGDVVGVAKGEVDDGVAIGLGRAAADGDSIGGDVASIGDLGAADAEGLIVGDGPVPVAVGRAAGVPVAGAAAVFVAAAPFQVAGVAFGAALRLWQSPAVLSLQRFMPVDGSVQ
jgi:hypothetical protein